MSLLSLLAIPHYLVSSHWHHHRSLCLSLPQQTNCHLWHRFPLRDPHWMNQQNFWCDSTGTLALGISCMSHLVCSMNDSCRRYSTRKMMFQGSGTWGIVGHTSKGSFDSGREQQDLVLDQRNTWVEDIFERVSADKGMMLIFSPVQFSFYSKNSSAYQDHLN